MPQRTLALLSILLLASSLRAQAVLERPELITPWAPIDVRPTALAVDSANGLQPIYYSAKPETIDSSVRFLRTSSDAPEPDQIVREIRPLVPASTFRAGAGFYYIKPYFDTNPGFAQSTNTTTALQAATATTQFNFDWGYRFAPLVWVEYVHHDLFGLRARWWQFDCAPPNLNATNLFNPGGPITQITSAFPLGLGVISNPNGAGAGFNDTLLFQSGLRLNVYDFELTKEFRGTLGWIHIAAGARYAELAQSYDAFLQSTPASPGASTVASTLLSSHDFRGAGGTLALDAGFTLGDTGISLFCIGRGSLLYGVGRENASLRTVTTNPLGQVTTQTLDPSASQDRVLPVGEIEIGAEYARYFGRARFFVRTALANQIWFGAGNAANNQTITGTGTLLTVPVTQAADNHINLGFFGLTATIGFQY